MKPAPKLDEELSFREAAAVLQRKRDPHGRRLRNMVLARERQTGKLIAIRLSGGAPAPGMRGPSLRVTMGELYRAFPELEPARIDQLAHMVKPLVERSEERTREMIRAELDRSVEPRLLKLEKRSRIIQNCLTELAKLSG